MKKKLFIIAGPTAIGKSSIAVSLCKKFNGSVVSADSMQVYKGMNIGTGKITPSEMDGVSHYMLDVATPDEYFTVYDYVNKAKTCIEEIYSENKLPFVIGGTGLYISGLINGHNFAETTMNEEVRKELKYIADTKGSQYLHDYLKKVDPVSAEKISANDRKRIIRALEIYKVTGKPKSESAKSDENSEYDYLFMIILPESREKLYADINNRVDLMIKNGLVDEVKNLIKYKDCNSMQAIGYKEILSYLNAEITLDQAIEQIKQNSRRYAKRQLTYFKNMKNEKVFVYKNNEILQVMSDIIKEKYEKFN